MRRRWSGRGACGLCDGPGLGQGWPPQLDRFHRANRSRCSRHRLRCCLSLLDDVEGLHRGADHTGGLPRRQSHLELHGAHPRNQCLAGFQRRGRRPCRWCYVRRSVGSGGSRRVAARFAGRGVDRRGLLRRRGRLVRHHDRAGAGNIMGGRTAATWRGSARGGDRTGPRRDCPFPSPRD